MSNIFDLFKKIEKQRDRQTAFEHKQAAIRPDFTQVAEPMELLELLNAS